MAKTPLELANQMSDYELASKIFSSHPALAEEVGEHENDHMKRMWENYAKEGFNVPKDWETNYSKYGIVDVPENSVVGYYLEDDEESPIITFRRKGIK